MTGRDSRLTVIRRSDGREWRIEPSDEGIPLVFGDSKYAHDPPRVASKLESALAEQLRGAVDRTERLEAALRWYANGDNFPHPDYAAKAKAALRPPGGQ